MDKMSYGHTRITHFPVVSSLVTKERDNTCFIDKAVDDIDVPMKVYAVGGILGRIIGHDLWVICRKMVPLNREESQYKSSDPISVPFYLLKLTRNVLRVGICNDCNDLYSVDIYTREVGHRASVYGGGHFRLPKRHEWFPPRM